MIPKIIHQTARSKEITWEEARLTRRLRRMVPGWEYRFWDDEDNARLVREQFPSFADQYHSIRFGVAKADIARYVYMHAHGGFYVDMDYKLLKPLDDSVRAHECVIPLEGADPHDGPAPDWYLGLGNAFMGSRAGHPFWRRLIEHIFQHKRPERMHRSEEIVPTTGPEAVTRFYLEHAANFPDIALPEKNRFYPGMSLMAVMTTADRDTYGVHLHWGSWRNKTASLAMKIYARRKLNGLLS